VAAATGWYAFALAVMYPIANAPVVDSWLYGSAVRRFLRTGEIRFAGYAQAAPIAQVLYGAVWGRVCGAGSASLTVSMLPIAVLCAVFFDALVRRCGASRWQALAAAGLIVCNPCFLFLSFSFMTEVPFLMLVVGAYLAFAKAGDRGGWGWIAAALCVAGFMIRPFAVMAIAGCVGAAVIDAVGIAGVRKPSARRSWRQLSSDFVPFVVALIACAIEWRTFQSVVANSWQLQAAEGHFSEVFEVPIAYYLRAGLLGPLLYLGTVLAPLALIQFATPKWKRAVVIATAIIASALFLMRLDNRMPETPEYSCFGGWRNVLILRGLPNRFLWESGWQYVFLVIGSFGAAGLVLAGADAAIRLNRAALAVVVGALVYWAAMFPLWFFNDRYYLPLVPAGAILLGIAPLPRTRFVRSLAASMLLIMGLMSLGGTYSYQRGIGALVQTRDELEREGVPRASIDAGYSLNGNDLYRYPVHGIDTMELEAGIPMITSPQLDDYTISGTPIPGLTVMRQIEWPGPFGVGHRYFYLLKQEHPAGANSAKKP